MSATYEQRSARRKLAYFGIILVLLTLTILWRGVINLPNAFAENTILAQAERLEMREIDQGESELTGSAIRLVLTGSRGLAICSLWIAAQEKQKRHEWNELELLVKSITKLQPHFVTPWLFQSWNIAYNVSVESDRLNDMYFYISRGIELLAEGERVNRNNPDLRYWIGFTYQNKFGVSDKVDTLRCLYQLSCIPPDDRDAKKLRDDKGEVNLRAFEEFCQKNPQLVRRLRESKVACINPADVIDFLKDNRKVPSRYSDATTLAKPGDQFPTLPPAFIPGGEEEQKPNEPIADSGADAFLAARAWYRYSLLPLPDPDPEPAATPDRAPPGKRIPRKPMMILFRQGAARTQSYLAERLQAEGWFDETGWTVDERMTGRDRWFPEKSVIIGSGTKWSKVAWERAYDMWYQHGRSNGLLLTPEQVENYRSDAQVLVDRALVGSLEQNTPPATPDQLDDPILARAFDSHRKLMYLRQNLSVTNFTYFLYSAEAEKDDLTIQGRKLFFAADRLAGRFADESKAISNYREAFDLWKKVFVAYPQYHRDERSERSQEDAYEKEFKYERLLKSNFGSTSKGAVQYARNLVFQAGSPTNLLNGLASPYLLEPKDARFAERIEIALVGPLSGTAPDGKPWIKPNVKDIVRQRSISSTPQPAAPDAANPIAPKPQLSQIPAS